MSFLDIMLQIFLPISLFIIMLGMGMTLIVADFTRIAKSPKSVIIGLTNQLILLPLVGFALAVAFKLEPVIAVGVMIIAVCPGGVTSNLITQVCRGNIALSVTLTAIASCIGVFAIPFILSYSLSYFTADTNAVIELPVLKTIVQILAITLLPISIGMVIRKRKIGFAKRMEAPMRKLSTLIFLIVFALVLVANWDMTVQSLKELGLVVLLLNLATMGLGFLSAKLFKLRTKDAISITIESGIQNGTLAILIATTILNNVEMALPTAAYTIWMFTTGGILMFVLGRRAAKPVGAGPIA